MLASLQYVFTCSLPARAEPPTRPWSPRARCRWSSAALRSTHGTGARLWDALPESSYREAAAPTALLQFPAVARPPGCPRGGRGPFSGAMRRTSASSAGGERTSQLDEENPSSARGGFFLSSVEMALLILLLGGGEGTLLSAVGRTLLSSAGGLSAWRGGLSARRGGLLVSLSHLFESGSRY